MVKTDTFRDTAMFRSLAHLLIKEQSEKWEQKKRK